MVLQLVALSSAKVIVSGSFEQPLDVACVDFRSRSDDFDRLDFRLCALSPVITANAVRTN